MKIELENPSPLRATWQICGLLALATLVVFWPVLDCDFVHFDDDTYFVRNPRVQAGLTWPSIEWALTTTRAANWHPVTWWSHMLDVEVYGRGAMGSHLTNVVLHCANAVLLFLLWRKLTGALWPCVVLAALFALHPLRVESVAWISERKDLLSAFFGLFTLLAYAAHAQSLGTGNPSARRKLFGSRYYFWSLVCFALGLMSKPMLVTLPFVMLLLDFWPLRRLPGSRTDRDPDPTRTRYPSIRFLILEKLPFLALSFVSCLITLLAQRQGGALTSLARLSWETRLANAFVSGARYLGKIFWPFDLAVFYPHPGQWPLWQVLLAAALVVGLSAVTIKFAKRWPLQPVGWFWFVGMLIPVIGLVQVGSQALADRYTYLPSIGVLILIVWGGAALFRPGPLRSSATMDVKEIPDGSVSAISSIREHPLISVLVLVLLAGCALRTRDQISHWRNGETLARHTLAITTNNAVAWNVLGISLASQNRLDEAADCYRHALKLNPAFPDANYNLGNALSRQGLLEFALAEYRNALEINPSHAEAYNNLGTTLFRLGRDDEAQAALKKALVLSPDSGEAAANLGHLLLQQGKIDEAIPLYRQALKVDPNQAEAHNFLGYALAVKGRGREAATHYRQALSLHPDYPDALNNLGYLLAAQGQTTDAALNYQRAIELNPNFAEAYRNLGNLLAAHGAIAQAVTNLETAVRLRPDNVQFQFEFARALAGMGRRDEAIAHLTEALRLRPDFAEASRALAELKQSPP